ncbi:A/G-specific adenine glycosylase [Gluconacetobacter entanii]|uniref:A/G-specific adenine glycosylase n=1 Tax=Gluconacetobacter entanii TaxID=108528 RepID=UPI001C936AA2|nr:A/G-specific adenine glycosylase [Gluconacetobacter entanii]MBE7620608.1 A/G-specific adenine glycosylase [Komagataeibacter sp. FXV2]MBY4641295.1 A/G-specific adenine glycosylase [Gluconacetobacter entanii]MCW4580575.1 A/G-specific adenine glycosylase [Gluconacetobacter entanii]MCW4583918.1 A/G-specific adenine glycosylase [Gluconacetobacter entanii]MCW4587263.1 A/G-specific adenine glycosylase [Gluconacetobacter entanii]
MSPSAAELLRWYDRHRRTLPWRALPGQGADPYHVWLSEIMLQQTTVTAVIPYFERFTQLFPTVGDLARADADTVMGAWAGLGYYARARNLHACAQVVARDLGGHFPDTVDGLRALPGIGPYTAAAIAAIAFGRPVVPVDGNVERVTTRLFAMTDPLPRARPAIARQAAHLNDDPLAHARPSDFAQALFDLGAGICTPRTPACALCPWRDACAGLRQGIAATLPRKTPKAPRPTRYGVHFHLTDASGGLLLHRRAETGLLGGTLGLPGPQWRAERWSMEEGLRHAPAGRPAPQWRHVGEVRHVFTHFTLIVDVYAARIERFPNSIARSGGLVHPHDRLQQMGIASLMRKCIALAATPTE